jgi:hypothetical protein
MGDDSTVPGLVRRWWLSLDVWELLSIGFALLYVLLIVFSIGNAFANGAMGWWRVANATALFANWDNIFIPVLMTALAWWKFQYHGLFESDSQHELQEMRRIRVMLLAASAMSILSCAACALFFVAQVISHQFGLDTWRPDLEPIGVVVMLALVLEGCRRLRKQIATEVKGAVTKPNEPSPIEESSGELSKLS